MPRDVREYTEDDRFQEPTKRCIRCREFKPTSMFSKNKNMQDGLFYYCKECHSRMRNGLWSQVD